MRQDRTTTGYPVTEAVQWKGWLTPKASRNRPVHRWYLFPHSYTDTLVHALIGEWSLNSNDTVLDPFVGAGTTILSSKERGVAAIGYDLSPLAVFVTNTKVARYCAKELRAKWQRLLGVLSKGYREQRELVRDYPPLVHKALSRGRLGAFEHIFRRIDGMEWSNREKDFFRLALVAIVPQFSDAVASGGWLKWTNGGKEAAEIADVYSRTINDMLSDIEASRCSDLRWEARLADARRLPEDARRFSAVITSPPYPNRHDYTRVFGVELMTFFLDWQQNRSLRYQSFHSHPEARPQRPSVPGYVPPRDLEQNMVDIGDQRLRRMLRGYFLDLYLCLKEIDRVCVTDARVAIVVGNAQYSGHPIMVDEYTAELGEIAGLKCQEIRAVRWRGNSAQQMKIYGRRPARESVVIFRKE